MVNKKAVIICTIIAIIITGIILYKNILEVNGMFAIKEVKEETNITVISKEENNIANNEIQYEEQSNIIGEEEKNTKEDKVEEKQENIIINENKNEEEKKLTGKDKAIYMAKEKWGEDNNVYYFIDKVDGNIYNISVRSKKTTEALAEYEIDIEKETLK